MTVEIEADLLGVALTAPEVTSIELDGRHFHQPMHGAIWDAIRTLHQRGDTPDAVSIVEAAKPERVDHATIVELVGGMGVAGNVDMYAERIRERWQRERLDAELDRARVRLKDPRQSPDAVAGELLRDLAQKTDPSAPPPDAAEDLHQRLTTEEYRRLRAREAAREQYQAERAGGLALPTPAGLSEFLDVADEPLTFRIDRLWPMGGRVVLSAPHKAGKSTLTGNLLRCLVDGDDFLERFGVAEATQVVLIDDELDERMLRRWLRDQGIRTTSAVRLLPMRGRLSTFNILDPATRSRWADLLRGTEVLLLDCLRPMLDALALSEDKDAGRFLEALDELTREAGITETLVVHHTGHSSDRSRGDSRIQDWPDAVWSLRRDATDKDSSFARADRYFGAYGRDVDEPESLLGFDPASRHLHIAGGSRAMVLANDALRTVLALLGEEPDPLSQRKVLEKMKPYEYPRATVLQALQLGITERQITTTAGLKNATLYSLSAPVRQVPQQCASELEFSAPVPCIEQGTNAHTQEGLSAPPTKDLETGVV